MISSGLGESVPLNIVLLPIIFEDQVLAVLELASFRRFTDIDLDFLDQLTESIGIVINTMQANRRTEELLMQSQSLTEELQNQQMELQETNEELEEKARLLVLQKAEVESKNNEVEIARGVLEEKAEQLALTSRYKSEFLANMSHELRTPLNSLLLLAEQLSENPDQNLTDYQVKFAQTIQDAGIELLELINDILDLSKIESGTVSADYNEFKIKDITDALERTFRHMVDDKKLDFLIKLDPGLPDKMVTDPKRLQQVLKNLLSNAFKFTEEGQVVLSIKKVNDGWSSGIERLNRAKEVICFSVSDTGIGIPTDKQAIIFEAFQQADGSTSREYGGTGLGLAISREITVLLGGEITLYSVVNKGSVFNLYLPLFTDVPGHETDENPGQEKSVLPPKYVPEVIDVTPRESKRGGTPKEERVIQDDRDSIEPGDNVFLIVEDDMKFNEILLDVLHKKGIKAIITTRGNGALELAQKYRPDAITLDLRLKDMDGWLVIDQLKNDLSVRHIPICVITVEEDEIPLRQKGVFEYVAKPVTNEELESKLDRLKQFSARESHRLLIVMNDNARRDEAVEILANDDLEIVTVDTGRKALNQLKSNSFDVILIDNELSNTDVLGLVHEIHKNMQNKSVPIILNRNRKWTQEQENLLEDLMKSSVIKEVKTPVQMVDESSLFLHRKAENLPDESRQKLVKLHESDEMITSKQVLVVDDDIRNIFALTTILERHNMKVIPAENGQEAIQILEHTPSIEIVLMDIMMPIMDGYETTRAIRKKPEFQNLPIIALTAKAMSGDREACLEAGASDYITKPVNSAQLLSLIRSWLDHSQEEDSTTDNK